MQSPGIKRVHTDTLEIGYEELGGPDSPAVILLHGFPDDAGLGRGGAAARRRRLSCHRSLPKGYFRRVIPDAGHFAHREQPAAVSDAVVAFLGQAG